MNRWLLTIAMPLVYATGGQVLGDPAGPDVFQEILFEENFDQADGSLPDPDRWVIGHPEEPSGWWVQGRTFFPNPAQHPNAPFPRVVSGALVIEHYHYNALHLIPPKTTFLGGEIRTVMQFDPSGSYRFEARVRWPQSPGGLVSSFFTYGYNAEPSGSDEIDIEFLSNGVFAPPYPVWTNTWNDAQQKPVWEPISALDLMQWQTFRIYWYPPARVEWAWIDPDGNEWLLRSETDAAFIPDEPMSLYFNFWAADPSWLEAYDASLEPDQQDHGVKYEYWIDRVEVRVARRADFDCVVDSDCDDGNPCTDNSCVNGECWHTNNTNPCDDGDACTVNDVCGGGICSGTPKNCDDGNLCTDDSCVNGKCRYTNNTNPCDDGDACTVNDVCGGGICSGTPKNCDDGDLCTTCACVAGECVFTPVKCPEGHMCDPETGECVECPMQRIPPPCGPWTPVCAMVTMFFLGFMKIRMRRRKKMG